MGTELTATRPGGYIPLKDSTFMIDVNNDGRKDVVALEVRENLGMGPKMIVMIERIILDDLGIIPRHHILSDITRDHLGSPLQITCGDEFFRVGDWVGEKYHSKAIAGFAVSGGVYLDAPRGGEPSCFSFDISLFSVYEEVTSRGSTRISHGDLQETEVTVCLSKSEDGGLVLVSE